MDLATVADFKVTLMAKSIQSEVTFKGMKNFKNKYVVIALKEKQMKNFTLILSVMCQFSKNLSNIF